MGLPVKEGLVRLVNFKPMARNVSPAAIPSGNLFTLAEAQYSRCTTALRGRNTP
jgi:hypothetical protein